MAALDEQFFTALASGDSETMDDILMENQDPVRGRRLIKQAANIIARSYRPGEPNIMLNAFLRLLSPVRLLMAAAEIGNVGLIDLMMTRYYDQLSVDNLIKASVYAARNGRLKVISWMVNHHVNLQLALNTAVKKKYRGMVHIIINGQPNLDLTHPTLGAVRRGQLSIVQDLVGRVKDPKPVILKAAFIGQAEILDWLLHQYPHFHNVNAVLIEAVKSGSLPTVEVALNHGAAITDDTIMTAFLLSWIIPIGEYLMRQVEIPRLIRVANSYRLPNLAVALIKNGAATVNEFPTVKFYPSHLRELVQSGIEDIPGYKDQVEQIKHRLAAETLQLNEYLPNVLSRLSVNYY